jgi:hypothetical protein
VVVVVVVVVVVMVVVVVVVVVVLLLVGGVGGMISTRIHLSTHGPAIAGVEVRTEPSICDRY